MVLLNAQFDFVEAALGLQGHCPCDQVDSRLCGWLEKAKVRAGAVAQQVECSPSIQEALGSVFSAV